MTNDKKATDLWPAERDRYGKLAFVPYGRFGARYSIPDDETLERLITAPLKKSTHTAALFFAIAFCFGSFIDGVCDTKGMNSLCFPLTASYVAVWYSLFVRKTIQSLPLITPRPPFFPTFRQWSKEVNPTAFWIIQLLCLGLLALLLAGWGHHPVTPVHAILRVVALGILALISLLCGLVIGLGGGRIAVRR